MIAASNSGDGPHTLDRLVALDREYYTRRRDSEPASSYSAGTSDRMNPVPRGIDPLGTDADYHYQTERNYFLMVERGRAAVRNHPLVEQGVNRLLANMRLDEFTLDVNSGDPAIDADVKAFWYEWACDPRRCDYERSRTFAQIANQSFFSQVVDGDIVHLPLYDGSLQTWESHHLRSPWGARPNGIGKDGIVHGVEVSNGRTDAYWITPRALTYAQAARRGESKRFDAFDEEGNKLVFWLGFTHRFYQRRGISRLSAPRVAMNGFDDLNYAHIKSALRRSLISYLMESQQSPQAQLPVGGGNIPQAGSRYQQYDVGLGLQSIVVEQTGEPAQVWKAPEGYKVSGWNANIPGSGFFEHAALMLNMLAVNLDLPLMFLLLDGSLVNFHGGRMIYDQVKLRLEKLIGDQVQGLYIPTLQWKTRQRITPGHPEFDPALYAATKRGVNPFNFQFRPKGWPYVKPLEDAGAEDLAERRNLKSMRSLLAARGLDEDEHYAEVIAGRKLFVRQAIIAAQELAQEFPDVIAKEDVPRVWRELRYGSDPTGVQLATVLDAGEAETPEPAQKKPESPSDG